MKVLSFFPKHHNYLINTTNLLKAIATFTLDFLLIKIFKIRH